MTTVIINGQEIEIDDGERLNGIEAARRVGVDVPHYCWHAGLSVVASCRMCLVETGRRDPQSGEISMMPRLVPACQTPASDNTVFVTNSEKVAEARAMVEEDLLIRHPIDCPICDKAGECSLQDYHFKHGQGERRADIRPFTSRRRPVGDSVTLFVDRCVMCTRCVRFTREITGTSELMVINRGAHEEIDVFPGYPLDNKLSGNVVDLCPVGALGDTDFLYSQRVWFMKSHDNVCAGCSTGCSISIEENQDHVYRIKPRENPHVNQWWMCDDGRYGFKHIHDKARVTEPRQRGAEGFENIEWSVLPAQLDRQLRELGNDASAEGSTRSPSAARLAAIISPYLTVEEAFLLATYIRDLDPQAVLTLGPIPFEGDDESFPNGFTIRAEKCPNRRGVAEVIAAVAGESRSFDDFMSSFDEQEYTAVWCTGGYRTPDWIDADSVEKLSQVSLLIVQDTFASPIWNAATYQLPGATFAERQGSYVNHDDRLQAFDWAIRSPAGVMVEGHLFWRLLGRTGLYQAAKVRNELAESIPFFKAAMGEIPTVGIDLRTGQLVPNA